MGQLSLFDTENALEALSKHGDPLERLNKSVDWKIFKPILEKAFRKERKSNAGRPPFDYVVLFKVLVLQELYGLSDSQIQYQLIDRFSFRRFVGIAMEDRIPDEKTVWFYREQLTKKGVIEKLFMKFNSFLENNGFKAQKGMIVDANIVEVSKQRNTREENKMIKVGTVPEKWKDKPAKLRQKDTDATWLKKNGKNHYGYKNHICIDNKNKLIRKYTTSPTHVHDSEKLFDVLDRKNSNKTLWADSAYYSAETQKKLLKRKIKSRVHRKGYRNKALSEFQQNLNTKKSKVRARVEHVFGRMNMMHDNYLKSIGQLRAASRIGIRNLIYNLTRYEFLVWVA